MAEEKNSIQTTQEQNTTTYVAILRVFLGCNWLTWGYSDVKGKGKEVEEQPIEVEDEEMEDDDEDENMEEGDEDDEEVHLRSNTRANELIFVGCGTGGWYES